MKKLLLRLLLAVMLVPWAMQAQDLVDYTFRTGVDTSKWIPLTSGATQIFGTSQDDVASAVINIGFNFSFGEDTYSQFSVNTNGSMRLGATAMGSSSSYGQFGNTGYMPKISGCAKDIGTCSNGYIKYEVIGTAPTRVLVVEHKMGNTYTSSINADVMWQVQLHEDSNKVVLVYGPTAPATTPSSFQTGLGVSATDFCVINPSTHAATFYTSAYSTTSSTWHGANRYYEFVRPVITCPKPFDLEVSNISTDTAYFTWTEMGTATQWIVEYDTAGFTRGTGNTALVTTNSYTANILVPNTAYDFYVRALCGAGDSSMWRGISFRTQCLPYSDTLPYIETFESYTASSAVTTTIDPCWKRYSTTTSTTSVYPYVTTSSGNKVMYMYGTTSIKSTLVMPAFTAPLQTLQLSFKMARVSTSESSPLIVGVLTDPNDVSTMDTIEVITCRATSVWEEYEIPLSSYTGTGTYIAFTTPDGRASSNYLDNITISEISECAAPTNVEATNISSTSADIVWIDNYGTSWIVEYGPAGFTPGTAAGYVETVTTTSISLSALTPSTGYDVYVRSDCGNDTSLYAPLCTFRTSCESYMSIPFADDFDSYGWGSGVRPQCWSYEGYTSAYPYVNSSYKYSGNASLYMYCYRASGSTSEPWTYLMTPEIDVETTPINTLEMSFRQYVTNFSQYYPGVMIIGVVSDTSDIRGSFYPIDTVASTRAGMWEDMEVSFANYPADSNGKWILLVSTPISTASYGYNYMYIDNIKIDVIPECARPRYLEQTRATESSVSLRWTDFDENHSLWDVAYGPMGFNPNTMEETMIGDLEIGVTEDSVTIDNLPRGVIYDFYVRTNCGGDVSNWRGPVSASAGGYNLPTIGIDTLSTCNATIFDNGGPGLPYNSDCNGAITIYPGSPDSVVAVVGGFLRMASSDYVKVFDGISTYGALLYNGTGNVTSLDTIKSTSGPLTIQLVSNSSTENDGFAISVACVEAPACPTTMNVEVDNITGRSAFVTWGYTQASLNDASSYELEVVQDGAVVGVHIADTTYFLIPNLDPETEYTVRVKPICAESGSEGGVDSVSFETKCLAGGEIELNNGTTTTTYFPTYTLYDYSYTQQLFTASELNGATSLQSVKFYQTSSLTMTRDLDIYLAETSQSSLSSSTAIPYSNLTLVYSDEYTFVSGENTIVFDTPFDYDGTSNLVLVVDDNTGDYTSTITFRGHSASGKAIYKYQDGTDILPSGSISFSTSSTRCDVVFGAVCDTVTTCVAPNVIVTSVEPNQVDIIWAAGNEETTWDVAYMAAGDTAWTVVVEDTVGTAYSFANLTPATDYSFRVIANCDATNTAERIVNVLTPCLSINEYPFFEGFDTWTASSTADLNDVCWKRLHNYTSGSTQYPYVSTSYSLSTNKSMYFYGATSTYSALILPKFSLPVDTLQVTFGLYKTSSTATYTLQVGVMTDPTDISTFTPVAEYAPENVSQWEMFEIPLSSYRGEDGHIAFVAATGATRYMYLDNVEVNPIPTCPRPSNVQVPTASITTTSAVVTWTDTNAASWIIEYGPRGFAQGTGTFDVASSNTYTIQGLNNSTYYDVYVYGLCSDTDTSLSSFVRSFATNCAVISNLPFTQDFTGYATGTGSAIPHYPLCWTGGSNYSTSYPYFNTVSNDVAEYLYCYASSAANSGNMYTYIAMPAIDSTQYQITDMMVSFRAKAGTISTYYDQRLYVGVSTDPNDPSTFVAIDTLDLNASTNWVSFDELDFSSYTGSGKYVTFLVRPVILPNNSGTYAYSSIYVDDIELDLIPTCRRPMDIHVTSATSTSLTLAWTERNNATSWEIEYGPAGFALGTGTTVTANSNPYTIAGLTSNTEYDFYITSLCSTTDHSRPARVCTFSTSQVPATIPYSYDFETEGEWANWGTVSNNTVNWFRGTATAAQGSRSMYVSANNGTSNTTQMAVVNTAAYRDFDFGTTDTNFTVSFKAKAGGSPEAAYDGLMIFLVDPAQAVVPSSAAITSPWGSVNSLYRIGTVRMDTVFSEYTVELDTISGIQRLAFFYFNQNTSFIGGPAAVDDINVTITSCPRPNSFRITNLDATTADFAWNGTASGYYFYYTDGTRLDSIYTTSNSLTLTGLTPNTQYACAVKSVCGTEMSIYSDQLNFATPQILAQLPYFCGFEAEEDETTQWGINNGAAVNKWYIDTVARDSGSYALYISQDNGATNTYNGTSISVSWAYRDFYFPSAAATDTFEINFRWMCEGESSYDYIEVYIGAPAAVTAGAVSSLAVPSGAVKLGRYNQESAFVTERIYLPATEYGGSTQRVYIAWRNDASVEHQPAAVIDNFYILSPVAGCVAPLSTATPASTTAEITFDLAGNYEVAYKERSANNWSPEQTSLGSTTYTITGLQPLTTYDYRVRKICDSTSVSNWKQGSFETSELPCVAPMGFSAGNIEMTSVTVYWTDSLNNQEAWVVAYGYGNDASAWDTVETTTPSADLTGLYSNTEYTVRVMAYCSVESNVYGDWSAPFTFRTASCEGVTNVVANDITAEGATISWTAPAGQTKWEISYGLEGVLEDNGNKRIVENTPVYTITGLESEFTYDVYVRSICQDGVYSAWSTKAQFRTTRNGINTASADNVKVQIYPNPANSEATVTVDGITGEAEFVLADMNGRIIVTETVNCEGSLVKTINVSNLAKGAYFVHIYNNDFNTTRKLIVK